MSLFPYRYAAAQEAAKTGMPIMRALVLTYQDDAQARVAKDEYLFGPDLLVAPVMDENHAAGGLSAGGGLGGLLDGCADRGRQTVVGGCAGGRGFRCGCGPGAVIPKIPEDVMTLVPQSESGNSEVKSLDDRRVYEMIGDAGACGCELDGLRGAERGAEREVAEDSGDSAAHMIVRWRFAKPKSVTVDGQAGAVGGWREALVEFDHLKESVVAWQ